MLRGISNIELLNIFLNISLNFCTYHDLEETIHGLEPISESLTCAEGGAGRVEGCSVVGRGTSVCKGPVVRD